MSQPIIERPVVAGVDGSDRSLGDRRTHGLLAAALTAEGGR